MFNDLLYICIHVVSMNIIYPTIECNAIYFIVCLFKSSVAFLYMNIAHSSQLVMMTHASTMWVCVVCLTGVNRKDVWKSVNHCMEECLKVETMKRLLSAMLNNKLDIWNDLANGPVDNSGIKHSVWSLQL